MVRVRIQRRGRAVRRYEEETVGAESETYGGKYLAGGLETDGRDGYRDGRRSQGNRSTRVKDAGRLTATCTIHVGWYTVAFRTNAYRLL